MTWLVERVAKLCRHLDHLRELRSRVTDGESLAADLSLHNDVLFSLLTVCQLVIDIAGELSARRGDRFEDYAGAVRNLARDGRFPLDLVKALGRLTEFRNMLVYEHMTLDLQRAAKAMVDLDPVEQFIEIVAAMADGKSSESAPE